MQALIEAAEARGERIALVTDDDGATSYGDLYARAMRCAGALDIAPGDRVAALIEPGPAFIAAFWGTLWRGGVFVPIALSHPDAEMAYVLDDATPRTLLCSTRFAKRAAQLCSGRNVNVRVLDAAAAQPSAATPFTAGGGMMLYTSGTTGRPKGAIIDGDAVAHQIRTLVGAWQWSPDDIIVGALPLHHVHGLINAVSCCLAVGARAVWHERFDPARLLRTFADASATVLMAVPTMYHRLLSTLDATAEADRERIVAACREARLFVSGSAALPAPLFARIEDAFSQRPLERYGMTEIGMGLGNPYAGPRVPGEVGVPFPGVDMQLVDDDDTVVDGDGIGEIRVRGASLFSHYHGRPDATANAFDARGYFKTGDRAERIAGRYKILGRQSVDILKSGGYKISALQIEAALLEHAAVSEACVVGAPDEELGQSIVAVLVAPAGAAALSHQDVRTFLKPRLAPYKLPRRVLWTDALVKNAMGKVQKPAMLEWVLEQGVL